MTEQESDWHYERRAPGSIRVSGTVTVHRPSTVQTVSLQFEQVTRSEQERIVASDGRLFEVSVEAGLGE